MRPSLQKKRPHPDEVEAQEWVRTQIGRLRSLSYGELLEQSDEPVHYTIRSRTGKRLMGETYLFWESSEDGPLWVTGDVCEPKPWGCAEHLWG